MFHPDQEPSISGTPGALYPPAFPTPVHARKGGGQMEKTHNTEGLGSENISMFFSNSIANKKGFLPRPAPFRAWGQGKGTAGSSVTDTTREATGRFGGRYFETSAPAIPNGVSGVFTKTTGELSLQSPVYQGPQISEPYLSIAFSLSGALSGHTGSEIAPVHIWQPCIVYLGNSA